MNTFVFMSACIQPRLRISYLLQGKGKEGEARYSEFHSPTACRLVFAKRLPTPFGNGERRRRHVWKNCFCNARTRMKKEDC
jgi:hypothetical protein